MPTQRRVAGQGGDSTESVFTVFTGNTEGRRRGEALKMGPDILQVPRTDWKNE